MRKSRWLSSVVFWIGKDKIVGIFTFQCINADESWLVLGWVTVSEVQLQVQET